jgi:hypothetical protein
LSILHGRSIAMQTVTTVYSAAPKNRSPSNDLA